jgi:hypothetical protein
MENIMKRFANAAAILTFTMALVSVGHADLVTFLCLREGGL